MQWRECIFLTLLRDLNRNLSWQDWAQNVTYGNLFWMFGDNEDIYSWFSGTGTSKFSPVTNCFTVDAVYWRPCDTHDTAVGGGNLSIWVEAKLPHFETEILPMRINLRVLE